MKIRNQLKLIRRKKKFMGKEFMGQIRSTFLIKDSKILNEWRNVRVKDHAKEVLNFLKSK